MEHEGYSFKDYLQDNGQYVGVMLPLIGWQFYCLLKMFKKHQYQFEPPMLLEFITLINFPLMMVTVTLLTFQKFLDEDSLICVLLNFGVYLVRMSLFGDWCVTNVDRLLTLYWCPHYAATVTLTQALIANMTVKTIATGLSIVFAVTNRDLLKCSPEDNSNGICKVIGVSTKVNFNWIYVPFLITLVVVMFVTCYVILVLMRHEKRIRSQVQPAVALPPVAVVSGGHGGPGPSGAAVNNWMSDEQEHYFQVAKKIFSVNLPILCMLIILAPFNTLRAYMYFSGDSCSDNQTLKILLPTFSVIVPLSVTVYFYIAGKKLENLQTNNVS